MYYLAVAFLYVVLGAWRLDRRQLRRTLPAGMAGAALAALQNRLGGELYPLWHYQDTPPVASHSAIAVLGKWTGALLLSMLLVQGLGPRSPLPWRRLLGLTALCFLPEVAAFRTGRLVFLQWWNLGFSALSNWCSGG